MNVNHIILCKLGNFYAKPLPPIVDVIGDNRVAAVVISIAYSLLLLLSLLLPSLLLLLLPCMIKNIGDPDAAAATTIENLQRHDLNPIEEAQAYQKLVDEFDYQHDEVATIVGKSRAHVSNYLRLLRLPEKVQSLLKTGEIQTGHAKILPGLDAIEEQIYCALQTSENAWTVRQLQNALRTKQKTAKPNNIVEPDIIRFERLLSHQLGAPVELSDSKENGGWLKIRFYDNEILEGILTRLGLTDDELVE